MTNTAPPEAPSPNWLGRLTRKCADQRGAVAIEFAVAAPLLALLLTASVEFGFAARAYLIATQAASSGASYAAHNGWNLTDISGAVTSSSGSQTITASPTAVTFCGCPVANRITTAVCGTTCADNIITRRYATVSASVNRTSIFPAVSTLPTTVTASATVQLQ
jgi:Flp pilus assembly protein TadG